jgi:hypothetical protein
MSQEHRPLDLPNKVRDRLELVGDQAVQDGQCQMIIALKADA